MNLKCVKQNRYLVKGAVYECLKLVVSNQNNSRYFRPFLVIKGLGHYPLEYFRLENGDPLPTTNWVSNEYSNGGTYKTWVENPQELTEGEILVCEREGSKYLRKGEFYKITHIEKKQGYRGQIEVSIRILGYARWLSTFSFRRATAQELREIQLSNLFGESVPSMMVRKDLRKFDRNSEIVKKSILIDVFCRSLLDKKRNNLSVAEWAIQKIEPKLSLTRKDFDLISNLSISQFLDN